ncbi:MAG: DUF2937 family protein [Bacteroidia bacterium]|nr:DUF2937 family protein [Bacteroidia bacterium]
MRILANITRSIGQLLARILCAAAALLFMQIPIYIEQYTDILVEARDEARPVFEATQRLAFQNNFSPEAYLDAMDGEVANQDSLQLVKNTLMRFREYDENIEIISQAPLWKKPIVFMQHSEKSIREAMEFVPSINTDVESLLYGLMGILLCSFVLYLLAWPIRRARKNRSPK